MSVFNRQYKFIDLFCGCGGLSLGFKQAGFVPVAGIDFNEYAIQTYQKNFTEAQAWIIHSFQKYTKKAYLS